ncbi:MULTISPECIES: urease accessory protein UreE [Sphingobacterium]|uniref:Urease accessory protein UreE n=1 Tax=Sphingobacterium populi TaxID=1812824 RepID=A0ABW5U9T2_9SPHI|nr:hypothetical protein [Sphingobacterium sp. CFCC 11742]
MLQITDEQLDIDLTHLREEQLCIEWFEAGRSLIKRNTVQGTEVCLQRRLHKYLNDGQVIYSNDDMYISISTLACPCMVLTSNDADTIGDFCYDVGNRHLPVFYVEHNTFGVAYDARLYEALSAKYGVNIRLENRKLIPNQALQQF